MVEIIETEGFYPSVIQGIEFRREIETPKKPTSIVETAFTQAQKIFMDSLPSELRDKFEEQFKSEKSAWNQDIKPVVLKFLVQLESWVLPPIKVQVEKIGRSFGEKEIIGLFRDFVVGWLVDHAVEGLGHSEDELPQDLRDLRKAMMIIKSSLADLSRFGKIGVGKGEKEREKEQKKFIDTVGQLLTKDSKK